MRASVRKLRQESYDRGEGCLFPADGPQEALNMDVKWLDLIDAAYRTDGADDVWLSNVMDAATPMMSRGLGMVGVLYDASRPGSFHCEHFAIGGMPIEGITPKRCREALEPGPEGAPFIQELFGQVQCGLVSETFAKCFPTLLAYTPDEAPDIFAVNSTDPTLQGCVLTANVPDHAPIDPAMHLFWSRLSAHLATAYRLRRRLRAQAGTPLEQAEAILTPDAKVAHATEPTVGTEVRELLSETVRTQERLRAKDRRGDPEAVGEWKALVDARWSLVDHVDTDGKRVITAQRNESVTPGAVGLSRREEQVLGYAALGHSNKLIAYELGLAHSTVRVLLARAAGKLGARGRDETLKKFSGPRS
jgi:DNA-binding CsgD family transcriptional regulator